MAQGVLSFQYEEDRADKGMTALSGLPVYLDLAQVVIRIPEKVEELPARRETITGATVKIGRSPVIVALD